MEKRLTKVSEGKVFLGVCTGLAKYFDKDVQLVRILTVFLSIFSGAGLIAYLIFGFMLPSEN